MALTSRPVGAASVRGTCRASRQAGQGRAVAPRSRGRRSPACAAVPSDTAPTPPAAASSGGGSKAGRMTYKPASYAEIVSDAVKALQAAMADGHTLCEIEFPPVPSTTDAYKGSSEVFIDANLQLALAAAKQLSKAGKSVQIIVPDAPELERAEKRFGTAASLVENVSFGALSGARRTGLFALLGGLGNSVAPLSEGLTKAADVYLIVNLSCVELQPLETFINERLPPGSTAVTFNLELDTQRGDLGLPGFPGKDLHYRFLSRFLPVLYLRPRAYSKTVAVAPFLLNYSGATFREYPGPWQVMLRADSGELACIAERVAPRYGLGEAKEEMLAAMGLNTEDEGSSLAFLRRGYKTATWWEEAAEQEASAAWRS